MTVVPGPFAARAGHTPVQFDENPITESMRELARVAKVRIAAVNNHTVTVFDRLGNESVGRLHRNVAGWRGVVDVDGETTPMSATPDEALAALLRVAHAAARSASIAAHPAGSAS
jgi:hypothetical protein